MAIVFRRECSPYKRSLPASRYRADSATTNAYFWVAHLAQGGLSKATKRLPVDDDPVVALGLPQEAYIGRLGHDIDALSSRIDIHNQWRKLLTLVMISASLERYLHAIANLAILSDPLLEFGFPKRVDGAELKKHGLSLPLRDISRLTTGEWSQRLAFYESLFGSVPDALRSSEGELEFLRRARNRIAHALGVDDGYGLSTNSLSTLDIVLGARRPDRLSTVSISDKRVASLMGIAQSVVDAIDAHLMVNHVGAFELIDLLLEWKADRDDFERRSGVILQGHRRSYGDRFRKVLGELFGTTMGDVYIGSLEEFVRRL